MHDCRHLLRLSLVLGLFFSLALRPISAAERVTSQPPTTEECAEFGQWLVERIKAKEYDAVTRRFDTRAQGLAATGLSLNEDEISRLSAGVLRESNSALKSKFEMFNAVHFVRVQDRAGQRRVLLRFVSAQEEFIYLAFVCVRSTEQGVMWSDWFEYTNAQLLSATVRQLSAPIAPALKGLPIEKLLATAPAPVVTTVLTQKAVEAYRQGKPAEALAVLRQRPAALRDDKLFLLFEIRLSQAIDEKAYLQSLAAIEKVYPNDSTLDLILLGGDYLKKDYASALRRLTSFEQELGGDAYLHYLRANVHVMQENWAAAKRSARAALADEPKLFAAYDTLMLIATTEKNDREIADILTEIETRFPAMDMHKAIQRDDSYAAFRQSPAYSDWVAARAKRAAAQPNKNTP